ncbi:MAG: hypothetical protein M0Q44_01560 [Methylobacter sp.]|jgi:hypothetical protein|nr:hypothetical protein [Methylobacter sp.]
MNESAKIIYDMLQNGTDVVMKPENLEIAKKAFPIEIEQLQSIQAGSGGLVAVGFNSSTSFPIVTWTNEDGEDGYKIMQPEPVYPKYGVFQKFAKEAIWRIKTAWRIIISGENDS